MKSAKIYYSNITFLLALTMLIAGLSCSSDLLNPSKKTEDKNVVIDSLVLDAYVVDPGDTVTATVTVKDSKNQALSYDWTADNGWFLPPLDKAQVQWKAPAVGGAYRISVTVSNDEKSASRSVSLTVKSLINPSVKIVSPSDGGYFVKYDTLSVTAQAHHDNGIAYVDLYINRNYKTTLNGHPAEEEEKEYTFHWLLDEPSGPALVTVEAVSKVTEMVGKDSVNIFIEGIVLGKTR
jgi:hypothetical protein